MKRAAFAAVALATVASGCAKDVRTTLAPQAGQSSIVRDGQDAIISRAGGTEVIATTRKVGQFGEAPVLLVMLCNRSSRAITFRQGAIRATTSDGAPLKVWSRDELVQQAKTDAVIGAALGGALTAANVHVVAGHYSTPVANQIVSAGATTAGSMVASNALAEGQMNAAALESTVLADNTVLPGECVGGKVVVSFDIRGGAGKLYEVKSYVVSIPFGTTHQFRFSASPILIGQR